MLSLNEDVFAPKLIRDFFASDQVTVAADEQDEQFHGDFLKLDDVTIAAQLIASKV